ncbi:serine hydrolase domain-containing protein [Ekhidna sp.]|uniref:serine hydrolase domain-containing protein n=1 Tax=Ekhidna sp. TaxID=2608089 RepID=UPI003B505D5D
MKISFCALALIGVAGLAYALFQPIIEWNFGWNLIPEDRNEISFEGMEDPIYIEAINSSKQHLDSVLNTSEAPSISIAAMIHGRMIWSYAVGFKDLEKRLPADTATKYRIGSVSKALTSLGLGRAIEKNQIHLDSSLQFYAPIFEGKPDITIRQLASHQSGIRNYGVCFCFPIWEYYRDKNFQSIKQSLSDFKDDPLLFNPGESFSYSSYNYVALSYAIERASDRNFLSYMGEYVFSPLQIHNTEADKPKEYANRATPYDVENRSYKRSFTVNLSNKWAGGGFISTPSDLVRAGNALLDSSFLSPRTIEMLTSPQALNDGSINEQNYALGWRHDFSEKYFDGTKKVEVIHHGGMAMGGLALLVVYPEYDLVVAITMNKSGQRGRFELFDIIAPVVEELIKIHEVFN